MNMKRDLVSILTPTYNSADYLCRLFDSVLSQSYQEIEMIVVDDGSTDNTKEIVSKYELLFSNRGYDLKYLYQVNQGQSVAIKNGLNYVSGEYLTWPDSDDFYSSNEAIREMVRVFKFSSDSVGIVRTKGMYIEDRPEIFPISPIGKDQPYKIQRQKIFEDCLLASNGFYFAPIGYMVKTHCLWKVLRHEIYTEKDAGQNWQLYLPMLYNYDCVTLPQQLHYVTVRASSHSRGAYIGYERLLKKYTAYENTLLSTIENIIGMDEETCKSSISKVKRQYNKKRIELAYHYNKKRDLKKEYGNLRRNGQISWKEIGYYYISILRLKPVIKLLRSFIISFKKSFHD